MVTLNDFYENQEDYIEKANINNNKIEASLSRLEDDLETIQASITPGTLNDLKNALINYVDNSHFGIWQRGLGPFTGLGIYGPDRWYIGVDNGISMERGEAGYVTEHTLHTSGKGKIFQNLPNELAASVRDMNVKYGVYIKTDTSDAARLGFFNGLINQWTGFHSGSNNWELYFSQAAVADPVAEAKIILQADKDVDVYWCGAIFIRSNPNTLVYVPRPTGLEMIAAQTYYETGLLNIGGVGFLDFDGKRKLETSVRFATRKKNIPSVNIELETGSGQYELLNVTEDGFSIQLIIPSGESYLNGFSFQDVFWEAISPENTPWYI